MIPGREAGRKDVVRRPLMYQLLQLLAHIQIETKLFGASIKEMLLLLFLETGCIRNSTNCFVCYLASYLRLDLQSTLIMRVSFNFRIETRLSKPARRLFPYIMRLKSPGIIEKDMTKTLKPLTHQFNPLPHNPHNRPSLNNLTSTTTKSILDLSQPTKPTNHYFRLHIQLRQLLCYRSDNIRQRQTLRSLQRIDRAQAAGDI